MVGNIYLSFLDWNVNVAMGCQVYFSRKGSVQSNIVSFLLHFYVCLQSFSTWYWSSWYRIVMLDGHIHEHEFYWKPILAWNCCWKIPAGLWNSCFLSPKNLLSRSPRHVIFLTYDSNNVHSCIPNMYTAHIRTTYYNCLADQKICVLMWIISSNK